MAVVLLPTARYRETSAQIPSIRVSRASGHPTSKSNFPAFRSAATQTPRQGQILVALTAAGPQGLRPAEVRQVTGVPQGTVASALHGLVQRGQVRTGHDRSVATGQECAAGP